MGYGIFLPRRWLTQPQGNVVLDRSNQITTGAVAALLPGTPYNIVTGESVVITGSVTVKTTGTSSSGIPVNIQRVWTNTATGASLQVASRQPVFNGLTYGGLVAGNGADSGMLSCMSGATTQGYRFITGNSATPGKFRARISSSSTWTETGDITQNTGQFTHITATWSSGGVLTVYFNGVSVGASGTLGGTITPSAALTIFAGAAANHQWALMYSFRRAMPAGEVNALYRNPWQLFETKKLITYFIPSTGDVTIDTFVGNATAAGQQASISYDQVLSTNVGNATAAGQQADISYNQVLSASVGDATAAGQQATIVYDQVLSASVGNATAAGQQASISYDQVVNTNVGDATAAGLAADITVTQRIDATVGAATAAGLQAVIEAATTIDTQVGNATAAGLPAIITVNADINTTVGAATAAGQQASIASNTNVDANVGNATAAGQAATLTYDQVLSAGVGNAAATGWTATLTYDQVLAAQKGDATATGQTATIVYDQVLATGVGNADAKGWIADIQGAGTINTNVGNAVAQGWQASITEGGGPVTGVRNRIRLRSFTERRRI